MIHQKSITLGVKSYGFHIITDIIYDELKSHLPDSGLVNLFIQHTSAGICINESADSDVLHDFQRYFDHLIPENLPGIKHTMEGPDDMPAHIKSTLTGHSLNIPITNGKFALGIWQGIYLCEFRYHARPRTILCTIIS